MGVQDSFRIIADNDLSPMQVMITTQTYDRFAKEYADKWEWHQTTIDEIVSYNIEPFMDVVKASGRVLLVGSRAGRDFQLFSERGLSCVGIEPSYGLIMEAYERVPEGLFMQLDYQGLPFAPDSFDGVYANALTHVPKKDMEQCLRDYRIFLRPGGVLYLALKVGSSGVLVHKDLGSDRYHTLYTPEEVMDLIKAIDMKIVWQTQSQHTDRDLPGWLSLIAQKEA